MQTSGPNIPPINFASIVNCPSLGVAVQGPNLPLENGVYIKALSTNAKRIFVGDSTVSTSEGWELIAGEISPPIQVQNLADLWFVSEADNDKICYMRA